MPFKIPPIPETASRVSADPRDQRSYGGGPAPRPPGDAVPTPDPRVMPHPNEFRQYAAHEYHTLLPQFARLLPLLQRPGMEGELNRLVTMMRELESMAAPNPGFGVGQFAPTNEEFDMGPYNPRNR